MAEAQALREQLEQMAEALVAGSDTTPEMYRFLYVWKALQAAEANERVAVPVSQPAPEGPTFVPRSTRRSGRTGPHRAPILDAVAVQLTGRMFPTKTKDIFEDLPEEIREQIGGRDKKSNLSALLHHSPRFVSYGRDGWTLAVNVPATATETINEEEALGLH